MSRVQNVFQVDLGLRHMFEAPTVASLAKLIDDARRTRLDLPTLSLQPIPRDVELPLSFAQERLWFLQRLHPESAPYNISGALRISGRSNAVLIAQCINEIVRRHESLRTTIQTRQGQPVQVVSSPALADFVATYATKSVAIGSLSGFLIITRYNWPSRPAQLRGRAGECRRAINCNSGERDG